MRVHRMLGAAVAIASVAMLGLAGSEAMAAPAPAEGPGTAAACGEVKYVPRVGWYANNCAPQWGRQVMVHRIGWSTPVCVPPRTERFWPWPVTLDVYWTGVVDCMRSS